MNEKREKPLFKEHVLSHPLIVGAFGGLSILEAALGAHYWTILRAAGIIHLAVCAIFLIVSLIFLRLTVTVTKTHLIFGFGFIRRKVPISKIIETRMTEAAFVTTGLGVHIVKYGYWAWTAKIGRAVRVTLSPGNTTGYIISTDRPRDLIAAIENSKQAAEKNAGLAL